MSRILNVAGPLRHPVLTLALMLLAACASAASLNQGFEVVVPPGWAQQNNSDSPGTGWANGDALNDFTAQSGPDNSFAGSGFTSTTADHGDISNWLITPMLTFNNGDVLSFWTRTVDTPTFADQMEVRFSNVGGTNVGSTTTSVGTFTTLLLTVGDLSNPTKYPNSWTRYSATITGLSGPTAGAIAFRYYVTDSGNLGNNGDYIGVDTVTIVPEPARWLMLGFGLAVIARRRHG